MAAVQKAVKNGTLTRQPCEVCGKTKVDAHHDDYSRPLDVRWLCHRHHLQLHHPPASTIVVRTRLTDREWTRFRKLALDQNEGTSEIVGRLMRDYLELHAPEPLTAAERKASGVRLPRSRRG